MRKLVAYRLLRRGTSSPTSCTCHAPPCLPRLAVVLWLFTHLHIICVGWHSKGRREGLLIAATLAASHSSCLATCNSRSSSSSGSNGGPSRFRCLGTTRLLEEVASCQGREGRGMVEGQQRLLTISCHFLHFLVHCFRLLLGFAFIFTAE